MTSQIITDIQNKMTKGELSSSIKRTQRQIDRKIEDLGEAPEWLYTRLEKYTYIYAIRFLTLPA